MADETERVIQLLEDRFSEGPEKYSPILIDIKKGNGALYNVKFVAKDGSVKYLIKGLSVSESFSLVDAVSLKLKKKKYACSIDLSELPEDLKLVEGKSN